MDHAAPPFDLHRLRVLRAVARERSFSAAARALDYTQPAIGHHIRRLEAELGTPLVLRRGRTVELTPAGAALVRRADALLAGADAAWEEVAAVAGLRSGRVRLATFPSAGATFVPRALAALRARHPDLEVTLVEEEPPELGELIRRGEADVAVSFEYGEPAAGEPGVGEPEAGTPDAGVASVGTPGAWAPGVGTPDAGVAGMGTPGAGRPVVEEPGLDRVALCTDEKRAVVWTGHPLGGESEIDLRSLAGERFIGGCPRCRGHLVALCRQAGFEPDIALSTDDSVAALAMVAAGLGVSLLPALVLGVVRHPDVVVRPVLGRPTRTIGALTLPDARKVPSVGALLDALTCAAAATTA